MPQIDYGLPGAKLTREVVWGWMEQFKMAMLPLIDFLPDGEQEAAMELLSQVGEIEPGKDEIIEKLDGISEGSWYFKYLLLKLNEEHIKLLKMVGDR